MKVTHLYHSGCFIELKHHQLLFDYYQGDLCIDKNKPLYVFVSHSHDDHYNQKIFDIKHDYVHYILSNDIKNKHDALYVKPHQTYVIDDIKMYTLISTDLGVGFVVEVENQIIYFAGDLHWWHWQDESDEFNEWQRKIYQQEINRIDKDIDLACVIVDKRQEDDYLLGLQYFLEHVKSRYILPIHYFGNYGISDDLKNEHLQNPYQAKILYVSHQNQIFEI
ncbi:MAG: MBL fold metallo-hydrolase [Erysipelotrichaceae bacterium]|nr:MBL fold metallo-hydrolase [Erysipelotrichaceae bacterium]